MQGTSQNAQPALAAASTHATRLSAALQALAKGLPNPWDESTDFFHGFAAPLAAGTPLDVDTFRTALDIGARYAIDLSTADDRLAQASSDEVWGTDVGGGFRQLGTVMRATMGELSIAFARAKGVTRVRVWLFGRTSDGTLVGIRSIGTET
jgi:hypothetical protein